MLGIKIDEAKTMREANQRERELLIHYGSAASEAMFDYPCHFFHLQNSIGIIAYRVMNQCALIFGDPICPAHELNDLTRAFHNYCDESHLNIIYITVSEKFAKLVQEYCPIQIKVCEELIIDPQVNPIFKSHRLHHRMNKAIKHGLTFHEYIPFNQDIENSLMEIGVKWRNAIKGPNLFLGHLNFFESSLGKRWFYVKDGEQITSMAMLSQLEAQGGWLLKFFITLPSAFSETSEFLMISLLTMLQKENCRFLTKGMAPVDFLEDVKGFGYSSKLVKGTYKLISLIFKFKKRKEYWQRYYPNNVPSYLLISHPRIGLNEISALLKVFRMNYSVRSPQS
jgi:lysylphosphatidylglycerol synthetase-like protein (DUF2156 family)